MVGQGRVENLVDQGGFAGTGDPGDRHEESQRNSGGDIFQIIGLGLFDGQPLSG